LASGQFRPSTDPQKFEVPIPNKEQVLSGNPREESQQHEVTRSKDDKNQNGKRNTEMKLTGKKDRKLSKMRANIDKLQKALKGTS
jgi:hypothetical protein